MKKYILFFAILLVFFLQKNCVYAHNIALTTDNGLIKYETVDTRATSGIRWKTVGFTITRKKCLTGPYGNGGYPLKLEHAIVYLKDEWKVELETENAVYVTFTIPNPPSVPP